MAARALDAIDQNLHHLFVPQLETLDMEPAARRCGVVSQVEPDRGHGSAWMVGLGSDCLVTVLDLSVADSVDLTSHSPGYLCVGAMSPGSLDTMPLPVRRTHDADLIMYQQAPGTYPYRLKPRTSYASRSLCFTPRFVKQLASEHGAGADAFLAKLAEAAGTLSAPQVDLMLRRLSCAAADSPATAFRLAALMAETVACLLETVEGGIHAERAAGSAASRTLAANARALMEQNLAAPLTLEGIARDLCVSRAHLAAMYKQEMGTGVAEDLRQMRMARAEELLAESPLSVAEVGRAVGYPRQSSFTEAFKRAHGCTPAAWRRART